MKSSTFLLALALLAFSSCGKNATADLNEKADVENSAKDLEADISLRGGETYEKVITNPLVKMDGCKFIVSGTIEYRLDGETVATVDFGNGECDNIATKTVDGVAYPFELDTKDKDEKELDYEKIVVNPLVKIEGCDFIVAGTIEYHKEGEIVAVVDFGNGECDNIATKTVDGIIYEFEL